MGSGLVCFEESRGLSLCKSGCTIDEVAESPVADFLGGLFDIFGSGIDAASGKRRVTFESTGGVPDVASKAAYEIRSGTLLFAGVVLKAIGCSGRDVLSGIGRLLELIARFVRGRSQSIARALLHLGSGQ